MKLSIDEHALRREVAWRSRRPLATSYRAFTNAAVAGSIEPPVSVGTVAALAERDRRSLMRAIVELRQQSATWKRLHGSPLSFDERFFAVMLWARERDHEDLIRRLREVRSRVRTPATDAAQLGAARLPLSVPLSSISKSTDALIGGRRTLDLLMGRSHGFSRYGNSVFSASDTSRLFSGFAGAKSFALIRSDRALSQISQLTAAGKAAERSLIGNLLTHPWVVSPAW